MPKLATLADFEGGGDGAAYAELAPDGTLVGYRRYPFFALRADQVARRFTAPGARTLVAGCGWGYLVDELRLLGLNAWGCDASAYAISRGQALLPDLATRLIQADILVKSQLDGVRQAAGLRGNQRFDYGVSEDVLSALDSVAQAQAALVNLRATANAWAHIITCARPDWPNDAATRQPGYLWLTKAEWTAIIGTGEPILDPQDPADWTF